MATNQDNLKPNKFYHIYNHGNGNDKLFFIESNYLYFLSKFKEYISPIADTFAYCLMPNHFHFLVQIKSEEAIFNFLKKNNKLPEENITFSDYKEMAEKISEVDFFGLHISKQFSNLFNGYSQAINKQESRRGSLFIRSFNRKQVDSLEYLKSLILYIHTNPTHHQFVQNISDWKYISYHSFLSDLPTNLKREEVINMFDGLNNFKYCHQHFNQTLIEELEGRMV